jgi:hypothetical protein
MIRPKAQKKTPPVASSEPPRKARGRGVEFVPTPQQRQLVQMAAAIGIPQDRIARLVAFPETIAIGTLTKHFAEELELGGDRANLAVAGNLFRHATGSDKQAVTAAIFWMKTRARWATEGPFQVDANAAVDKDGTITRFTLKIGEREPDEGP